MAKGRKLTASRTERFLGTSYAQASTATNEPSELREEDVWSTPQDHHVTASPPAPAWDPTAAPRYVGGLSLAFQDPESNGSTTSSRILHHHHQYRPHDAVSSRRGHHMATSAPVNVPDWSKILRVESLHGMDDGFDDDDQSEMVPPHQYLAHSRRMAANSVFEGVGRTLKGRDMRRVRDAVWSQTGFDG